MVGLAFVLDKNTIFVSFLRIHNYKQITIFK